VSSLYALSIWLHLVAAAAWVGSMIFFAAVAVPVLRRDDVRGPLPLLIGQLGARYRVFGWVALAVLVVTGVVNLHYRGVTWALVFDGGFWSTSFGRALGWKLAFVAIVLGLTAAHERFAAGRAASWLGRTVLLASLAILFFAAALVRGFL
jgi:putative copper export protein